MVRRRPKWKKAYLPGTFEGCLIKKEGGDLTIQESGTVPRCPKTSISTSRAKALPHHHNPSSLPSTALTLPILTPHFFFPWSFLFWDVLSHQVHTNSSAATRQHCCKLALLPQCGSQEPPNLLVVESYSYMTSIFLHGSVAYSVRELHSC